MNIKQLFDDERAVSPVIGVILMVAITVILAAVIGTFVLGLGDQLQQSSPTASFGFDYEENDDGTIANLTVSHNGGDKIDADNVNVTANTNIGFWADGVNTFKASNNTSIAFADMGVSGDVGAGTTVELAATTDNEWPETHEAANAELRDATVRVVWSTPNSDTTAQLGKWSGPDA